MIQPILVYKNFMLLLYLLIWLLSKSKAKITFLLFYDNAFYYFSSPEIWTLLLDDVDFNYYHGDVLELLDDFDSHYSPVTSTINFDNLVALIMNRTTNGKYERIANELERRIPTIKTMKVTRLEFIALMPLIIYIESSLDHGKTLFRFRENSILNLHMKKALWTWRFTHVRQTNSNNTWNSCFIFWLNQAVFNQASSLNNLLRACVYLCALYIIEYQQKFIGVCFDLEIIILIKIINTIQVNKPYILAIMMFKLW